MLICGTAPAAAPPGPSDDDVADAMACGVAYILERQEGPLDAEWPY